MNDIALNLLEARITLYPADATGAPVLGSPIWSGAAAENLGIKGRWITTETRPSGIRYPRRHPFVPQFEILINRVWVLLTSNLSGFQADHQRYVLDIVWTEEETGDWHRRTFYGVTIQQQDLDAHDIESGFLDGQVFNAEYFVPASGVGTPPAINPSLPYYVIWRGTAGGVLLYSYDADTQQFTAQETTAGRATIGYDDELFEAQFAGDDEPAMRTVNSDSLDYQNPTEYTNPAPYRPGLKALIVKGGLFERTPLPGDLPRLEFYYGPLRICTLTRTGLFDVRFADASPVDGAGKFALNGGDDLIATLAASAVEAEDFIVTT